MVANDDRHVGLQSVLAGQHHHKCCVVGSLVFDLVCVEVVRDGVSDGRRVARRGRAHAEFLETIDRRGAPARATAA